MKNFDRRYTALKRQLQNACREFSRDTDIEFSKRKLNKKVLHDSKNEYEALLRGASNPIEKTKVKQLYRLIRELRNHWLDHK